MKKVLIQLMICFITFNTGPFISGQASQVEQNGQSLPVDKVSESVASSGSSSNGEASNSSSQQNEQTSTTATVHDFAEFKAAYEQASIQQIDLAGDIVGNAETLAPLSRSLVINGNHRRLTLAKGGLKLGTVAISSRLTMKQIVADQAGNEAPFIDAGTTTMWLLTCDQVSTKMLTHLTNLPAERVSLIDTIRPAGDLANDDQPESPSESPSESASGSSSDDSSDASNQQTSSSTSSSSNQSKESDTKSETNAETSAVKPNSNEQRAEREVASVTEFKDAYNDPEVTKINLAQDITTSSVSEIKTRTTSLEINGNEHLLQIGSTTLKYGLPANGDDVPTLDIHNAQLANTQGDGFTFFDRSATRGKWRLRFGNIVTDSKVKRLAVATKSEVTFYGNCNVDTIYENIYAGSTKFEDGTTYTGNVNGSDFSMFFYNVAAVAGDSGESQEFTTGKNCTLNLNGAGRTHGYPLVYLNYNAMTIGEGTKFNTTWQGNSVRFQSTVNRLDIQTNAEMNLNTDGRAVAAIQSAAGSHSIVVDSRGKLIARNTATSLSDATVNLGTGTNTFEVSDPAAFDLQNTGTNASNSRALNLNATSTFSLNHSPFAFWDTTGVSGEPTQSFEFLETLNMTGTAISSDPPAVAAAIQGKSLHRIAAYNPPGTLHFASVPKTMSFGQNLTVNQNDQLFPLVGSDQPLKVTDSRYRPQRWTLTVALSQPLINGHHQLNDALIFKDEQQETSISAMEQVIEERTNPDNEAYDIFDQWTSAHGLMLKLSPGEAQPGIYSGELTWGLNDVPGGDE